MPTAWKKGIKDSGQLLYFNQGGAWSADIDQAAVTFNSLGLGVKFTATKEKSKANVVIKLSMGADSETFDGSVLQTSPSFDASSLHGFTRTLAELNEQTKVIGMIFAATFLPGKAKATANQKNVVIVHEMIHASGLDGGKPDGSKAPDQDHDTEGVFAPIMNTTADGLIEATAPAGTKPMPPIRVGSKTTAKMKMIW